MGFLGHSGWVGEGDPSLQGDGEDTMNCHICIRGEWVRYYRKSLNEIRLLRSISAGQSMRLHVGMFLPRFFPPSSRKSAVGKNKKHLLKEDICFQHPS